MESIRVSKEVMKNTSDVFLDRLFDSLKSLEEIKVDGINLNQLLFEGTIKWCDELFLNKVDTREQIKNIINNNKPIDDLFNYLKELNKKDETEVSDLITILKPVIKAFDEIIFKLTNEIEYNQNYEEKGTRALQGSRLENLENKYVYIRTAFVNNVNNFYKSFEKLSNFVMNNEENIDKLDESVEKIKENMKNIQSEEFQLKKVEIKETDYYNVSFMDLNDGQKGGDKGYNKKIEKELLEEIKKNKEKTFSEFVEENVEKKAKSKGLIGKKTYSFFIFETWKC